LEKFKKIEKEFLLTDSTVNSYGFRLLTSGYLMDNYKSNPIGYHMHDRANGVLVKWDNLRMDGDKVFGKPVINMSHPRGQQTVDEIENGFLNAASVGHIIAVELSDDPSLKLENQVGPTVTKWFNRECSLVDIPGNFNALKLYDKDENEINLSDFSKTQLLNMKQIVLTPALIQAINLKAEATEVEVASALNDLVAKAAKADGLETQLNDLHAQVRKDKIEGMLNAALAAKKITQPLADTLKVDYAKNPEGLKNLLAAMPGETQAEGKVAELITAGLAAKKFTKELGDKLAIDYKDNAEGLKNLIAAMPTYSPLSVNTGGAAGNEKRIADLSAKSFDELMDSGESEELAKLAPDVWTEKKKQEGIGTK